MRPWKLFFNFGSYCHQELTVKSKIRMFSFKYSRLWVVFLQLWKDIKNEVTVLYPDAT